MFSSVFRKHAAKFAAGGVAATGAALAVPAATDGTGSKLDSILSSVKKIEADLGIGGGGFQSYPAAGGAANMPTFTDKHKSLTAKVLTSKPELYAKYADAKTDSGFTLDQAIQCGIDAPHLGVGIIAGDEQCYETFKDVFDEVIYGWHGYTPDQKHKIDIDPSHIKMSDEQKAKFDKHVISTRIRAGRSIRGLPLPPATNRIDRNTVERLVSSGLKGMTGELKGTYYPLGGMTPAQEQQLIDDHFLFQKPTARNVLSNAGAARDWPMGRGIFHNDAKNFLVWVNEEDHMRVISMQKGGNVYEVFKRFSNAITEVQGSIAKEGYTYMYNDHLGNICACPSNLGTGLRASVMLKLPKLYKKMGVHALEDLCDSMDLQARGAKGEHSPPGASGEFDISNKQRIGFSEVELIQKMIDGVDKLIKMEESA